MTGQIYQSTDERQIYQEFILKQLLKKNLVSDAVYCSAKRKLFKTHDENRRTA